MTKVQASLTVDVERQDDGSYRFVLLGDGTDVRAASSATYGSQATAVDAGVRLTAGGDVAAEVVEHDGGWAVRLRADSLEATTAPWPDRDQAQWALDELTAST